MKIYPKTSQLGSNWKKEGMLFWIPIDLPPVKHYPAIQSIVEDTLPIDLTSVQARLILSRSPNQLTAQVHLQGRVLQEGDIELHQENLGISQVTGTPSPNAFQVLTDRIRIHYSPPLQTNQEFLLSIQYTVSPSPNLFTLGYQHLPTIAFTFNEPFGARKWLPIHDVPYDRFRWSISVSAPSEWVTVSNSTQAITDTSYGTTNSTLVPYLIHFASAEYQTWNESVTTPQGSTLQLAYYVRPNFFNAARNDWQRTPQMIQVFSELIGEYPHLLDGYGMVEAPILGGSAAMEHLAMSTIGSNLITGDRRYELVVVHELAHQWFGNAVTPSSFQHIWLNEGFASYMESLWLEQLPDGNPIEHRKRQAENYFREYKTLRFPLSQPPPNHLFSATVYYKGAWVLHQLRVRLGDDEFIRRLRQYYLQNQSSTRSIASTQSMIRSFTFDGNDVETEHFLTEWMDNIGHPILRYSFTKEASGTRIFIQQVQPTAIFYSGIPLQIEHRNRLQSEYRYILLRNRSISEFWENVQPENLYWVWNDSALVEFETIPDERVRTVPTSAKIKLISNPTTHTATLLLSIQFNGIFDGEIALFDPLGRMLMMQPIQKISTGERYIQFSLPNLPSGYYVWSLQISKFHTTTPMIYLK
ncbi:MAG: M1 family aminopeptidase [bacterium]|nr:M1 family aminopeptidase [bacterium]